MRVHPCLALVGLLLLDPARSAAAAPTLDDLLGSPFPRSLVAASIEGKVAWIVNARGRRNIWVAEPPEYKGRAITSFADDDGQELAELAWTPDAKALIAVRGNEAHDGEAINPRALPRPVRQAVYLFPLDGPPRRLDEGNAPAVSPKGDRVAYLKKGQVWEIALDGKGTAARLFDVPGNCKQLRWSPDGAALAFVNDRGAHSWVGVYTMAEKPLRWLDPGVDRDGDPVWSPDAKQLAFTRIPASRELFTFGPRRAAEPWSIRVASGATGAGKEVWKASKGVGSVFHGIDAPNQLLWVAGDSLVFPWEKEGWTHLYVLSLANGDAQPLTQGKYEVESAALSADRERVFFSSNRDDIDRRHLASVSVKTCVLNAETTGMSIEWSPTPTSDGKALAFLRSDARRPAHAVIRVGSEKPRELALGSLADFPVSSLVEPQAVTITAADGMKVPAQLFLPPGHKKGERHPAILYTHGGSRRQMFLGWHWMHGYHHHYGLNQYLASRGFVVLSLNYRSGVGYGMEFREALDYGAHGASELNDVIGAGQYLKNRPEVDPERVGKWGASYGGYLTALALSRAPEMFAAGVDIHGVYDWNVIIRGHEPSYDPLVERAIARRAFESSPVFSVHKWRAPVLVIHGDQDPIVPFAESVRLVEDLRKHKVDVETLVLPDESHMLHKHETWLKAMRATAEFMERRLQRKDAP